MVCCVNVTPTVAQYRDTVFVLDTNSVRCTQDYISFSLTLPETRQNFKDIFDGSVFVNFTFAVFYRLRTKYDGGMFSHASVHSQGRGDRR